MKKLQKRTLEWTPVQLNEAILSSGVEGLIGIEELADYQFEHDEIQPLTKVNRPNYSEDKYRQLKKSVLKIPPKIKLKASKTRPIPKKTKSIKNPSRIIQAKSIPKFGGNVKTYPGGKISTKESSNENIDNEENLKLLPWSLMNVPTPVAKSLLELGFEEPTEIQRLAIPPAINGRRDILGAAETGSGKTLAFGIPIIHGILNNLENEFKNGTPVDGDSSSESDKEDADNEGIGCVRVVNLGTDRTNTAPAQKLWALILTPTRELAVQIKDHLQAALKYTDIKVVVVVGGMSMEKQQRLLKRQPHIVVATPGRLWELVSQGEPHFNNIEDIRYLAIDETDRMTEVNHFPELRSLLERINSDPAKQKLRQNFVFSATLTLVHELPFHTKLKTKKKKKRDPILSADAKLKKLIQLLGITAPKIIDVTKKTGTADLLVESSIVCTLEQKDYYLYYFLQRHPGRTLVFCNSISCVRRLASLLSLLGVRPLPIHANMIQKQRLKNLERFRDSPDGLLLATDVAARGLDIPKIEHVIHYQVPRTSESYVHRSGRTARANSQGLTLLLIETGEQRQYVRLLRTLNRDKELPQFPVMSSLMDAVKQRVNLARDIDKMQLEYKKASSKFNWVERAAQEMDLLLDDDEMPEKINDRAASVIKKQITVKQKQLKALLNQFLRSRGFSCRYPSLNENVNTTAGAFKSSQSAIETVQSASINEVKKRKGKVKRFKERKKRKLSQEIDNK